jgi:predicted O-linked N-acetylglucosamine transferase (SPINDLY family)
MLDVRRLIDEGLLDEAARQLEGAPDTRLMLRLAAALQDRGRHDDALAWYRRILEVDPGNGDALLCLAVLHEEVDIEQARGFMDRYIALRGDAAGRLRRALMLPAIAQSAEHIERVTKRLEAELDELSHGRFAPIRQPEFEVGATPFFLAYYGRNPKPLLAKVARACRAVYPTETQCDRKLFASGKKLRIGFISAHFSDHSVGKTMWGLVRDLPRESFDVHVFAIAPAGDAWSERIRRDADHYTALPLDLERARDAIGAARLDIAFFTDIGMDPLTYFLAFWRLAPIQLNSWGHSVTSGIDTIDYYVSHDDVELPEAQSHYSEKLIRLPGYFMPRYLRPALAGAKKTREALGLPPGRRLYYCPQNLFKFHPDFDAALKAILERDSEAEVVLVDSARPWTGQLAQRLSRTLGALGARVRLLPRMGHADFLQHLTAADVLLDPFYFGGCNSSCDTFALGAPIVTLPGFLLPGRFTLGLYNELDVKDCIARSADEFVDLALRLGQDPAYRAEIAGKISRNAERLFDRPDCGKALGAALLRIAEERR